MRRPGAAMPAHYVLTCLQEEVLKGKLCCFCHLESVGDGNSSLGDMRLTWKYLVNLEGLSGF